MSTRAIYAIIPILLLLLLTSVWAANDYAAPRTPGVAAESLDSLRKKVEAEKRTGVGVPTTSAREQEQPAGETARQAETDFQSNLRQIERAIVDLEGRVTEFRRLAVPPTAMEVQRLSNDIDVAERAAASLSVPAGSPLSQLQKAEVQDRLFGLQLAVGIMKRRWGGDIKVFGSDFFANAVAGAIPEPPLVPDSYVIRRGDLLSVGVLSNVGQRTEYQLSVDGSGHITVAGAGKIRAVGKTAGQLRQEISAKLQARFRQLTADVTVTKAQAVRVQVGGEVARPNTYAIAGTATVFGALCQAGGPTRSGSYRKVTLARAGQPKLTIDLYKFLLQGDKTDDLPLEEGDLIFVPPVGGTVTIEGEVIRPARYEPDFPLTLAGALKLAGGTSPGGYLQSVQVERVVNGEYRVLLDSSSKEDNARAKFVIQPGDQITVRPMMPDRTSQVAISGPVGVPGIYGFTSGMRVSDLITAAQGLLLSREVYGGRADILRMDPLNGVELVTFDLDKALKGDSQHNIQLQKLDRVFIYEPDQVVYRPRVVTVLGAVTKPGTYKRAQGMSVSDAVAAAGGVGLDAYLTRADLIRRNADGTTRLIRVNLEKALGRLPGEDVRIEDRDVLNIYTISEAEWRDATVRIEGAVQRPGVYRRSEEMRVSDLLLAGGGLLPEAIKTVEIGRWTEAGRSETIQVDLATMVPGSDQDVLLKDRDVLTIPEMNPALRSPEVVFLYGEVARPGPYALREDERLVDLIQRAGGLTPEADRRGLMFLRQKAVLENAQQSKDVDIILQKSRAFADKQFMTLLGKLGVSIPEEYWRTRQTSSGQLDKPAEVAPEVGEALVGVTSSTGAVVEASQGLSVGKKPAPKEGTAEYILMQQQEAKALEKVKAETRAERDQTAKATRPEELEKLRYEPTPREIETQSALGPRIPEIGEIEDLGLSMFKGRQDLADVLTSARISIDLQRAVENVESPDNIPLRGGDRISVPRITNVVTVIGAVLHPHAFAAGQGQTVDHFIERSGGFAQDAAKESVIVIRSNGDALPRNRARTAEPGDTIVVPTTGIIETARKWERIGPVTKVISDVLSAAYILTRL